MLSKILVLIYILDIHNLPTKTLSFSDQEKFLEEVVVVFSLAVSMNISTEKFEIKHCLCYNSQTRKNNWKITQSRILSFKIYNFEQTSNINTA